MADTFSQMLVQIVFAVKARNNLIQKAWEEKLFKYITGIVHNKGQKLLAINGMPDHIHILIGMKPDCKLSDLVREIKKSSNSYINSKKYVIGKFEWQKGYGVFTYHQAMLDTVVKYINNQKLHHQVKSFKKEYTEMLQEFRIEYQEQYLFEWLE